jgi:toxic protein SymE
MQKHWADTPHTDPSNDLHCPICQELEALAGPALAAGHTEDDTTPFMTLRGRWLEQMGFGAGSTVRVDASGTRITIDVVARPGDPQPEVPATLEREVHYTEVEPHVLNGHHVWSER